MKLSKSLIQAIAVGVTLSAATSCTLIDALEDVKPNDDSSQNVDERGDNGDGGDGGEVYFDCPACGMG